MSTDTVEEHREASRVDQPTTSAAALTAMGIVYGDLGTSPLYTLQAVAQAFDGGLSPSAALGSLSLIFWLLIITVSIKYCLFSDARRQPRRGRHSRADVAHARELARTRPRARHHGAVRRGLDLWRRHHHAGDLGAERARGSQSGDRDLQAARHADGGGGCPYRKPKTAD